MAEFLLQPGLYRTGDAPDLFSLLDRQWPGGRLLGDGTYFVIAGFGSHNGGVRFFERFRHHVASGGQVRAVFAGSRTLNMTSLQLVHAMIDAGAEVTIVNRKHILHSKLYGWSTRDGRQHLIVTSGNFTASGIGRNIESALSLDPDEAGLGFSWQALLDSIRSSSLDLFEVNGAEPDDPRWSLLYDEERRGGRGRASSTETDEPALEALVMTLGHADTARIMAEPGSNAGKGTQYFWLPKDSYDFFPPLTVRNARGRKATYSCLIRLTYRNSGLGVQARVTFEAENNLDFRLGTSPLRHTQAATAGDMAVLIRRSQDEYELSLLRQGSNAFIALSRFALTHIGHQGKRYGYAPISEVDRVLRDQA